NGSGGSFSLSGSGYYLEAGSYTVTVTVVDDGGATATESANVVIPDAPLSISSFSLNATQGIAVTNAVLANFVDSNANDNPNEGNANSDYAATIDWGDGNSSPGTVQYPGTGGLNVVGSHTYTAGGTF